MVTSGGAGYGVWVLEFGTMAEYSMESKWNKKVIINDIDILNLLYREC